MRVTLPSACLALGLALFSAVLLPVAAEAGGLKASIYLVKKPQGDKDILPKTEKGLLGFGRSGNMKIWYEDKSEPDVEKRKWQGKLILGFNQPPNDLEFHVLFYDVHDGARRYITDMSTFIDDKKQKTFVQNVSLPRPTFKPNRRMELVVTVRRAEVGSLKFILDGDEKKNTGVVSFGPDGK